MLGISNQGPEAGGASLASVVEAVGSEAAVEIVSTNVQTFLGLEH